MHLITLLSWIVLIAVHSGAAFAGSFEVAPTTMYLASGSHSGVFYITNRGTQPVIAQVEVLDWQQKSAGDQLSMSNALLVSPPMTRLLPGQRQTVRIAVKEKTEEKNERAFRLVVSELQDPENKGEQGVQVLLQFSVPVFMLAGAKTPPKLEWSMEKTADGNFILTAHNAASRHVKISQLALTTADGRDLAVAPETFSYVLADATRQWKMKLPQEAAGKTLLLKVRDENAGEIKAPLFIPQ